MEEEEKILIILIKVDKGKDKKYLSLNIINFGQSG